MWNIRMEFVVIAKKDISYMIIFVSLIPLAVLNIQERIVFHAEVGGQ